MSTKVSALVELHWQGLLTRRGARFVTDGNVLFDRGAVDPETLSLLESERAVWPAKPMTQERLRKLWRRMTSESCPAKRRRPRLQFSLKKAVMFESDNAVEHFDAALVRLAKDATAADEFRLSREAGTKEPARRALVLFHAGDPVALVAPLDPDRAVASRGAEAARRTE